MKRAGRKTRTSARLLSTIAGAVAEQLEQRQLLDAVVVPPSAIVFDNLPPSPGITFWVNGLAGSSAWSFNSIIRPNTVNDLVLNVTPFSQTYTGCCEGTDAAPGNTSSVNAARLLTNGLTQNQLGTFPSIGQTAATGSGNVSDASSGANVVSQNAGGQWWMEYNLGAWPGGTPSPTGYDISEIDVIAGNQDYRTGISVDIQVQYINGNTTDWFSVSNGANFSFTTDPTQSHQVSRGGAQMAIVNNAAGPMAGNVRAVKFFAANQQTWFREFVVTGTPSTQLESISPPPSVTASLDLSKPGAIDVSFPLGPGNSAPSPYLIQRAMVPNGAVGAFTTVGTRVTQISPVTFVDTTAAAGTVYVYRVVNISATGSSTSPLSNFITAAAISVEAHFYNQAFWSGPVASSAGLEMASIDSSTGAWPGTSTTQDSLVITGKVTTNQSGVYTFISNTDDDGYLYVNGVLVSEDPGPHGLRNAAGFINVNSTPLGTFHPILLTANTSYDFVLLEHHDGSPAAGAHMLWVTPSNATPTIVPPSNLSPVSDPPSLPSGLAVLAVNSNFVNLSFTADNRGVVEYLLQRKDVTDPVASNPWVTVGQGYPASDITQTNSANVITSVSPAQITIQDAMPVSGNAYMYRVAALNYDGVIYGPEIQATAVLLGADLHPPVATAVLNTIPDATGLLPGTYYLQYTWTNSAYRTDNPVGQTGGSVPQSIVLAQPGDILATPPPAPVGAINANIYIATSPGLERFYGNANAGQTLTIHALPSGNAPPVPTTTSAGLAPGTYFIAYTWLGNNTQSIGETSSGAVDNTSRMLTSDESSIVLTTFEDLKIAGFTPPPFGAQYAGNVNIYVGTSSGGEKLIGTLGPTGTLTINTLTTPTVISVPSTNTTASLGPPTSALAIPLQSSNPGGVEIHMYNGVVTDLQLDTQFQVPMNGLAAEYVAQTVNQSLGTFFPGVIDQDYTPPVTPGPPPGPTFGSPDLTLFPDMPRIQWEDYGQVYTGQLQVGVSGVYTIISNTDDSGFVWVNDSLVSADPGNHIQQDTTTTRAGDTLAPVFLMPGQSYDLTMEMQYLGGSGAGSHLKWIEPAVSTGNVISSTNNNGSGFAAVTLNSAAFPSVDLKGFTLFITAGAGAGQQAIIESWDSTNHIATVEVLTNGTNLAWGTLPNSTSQYSVAWEEMIPIASTGDNGNPIPGAAANGLTMRQDLPVQSSFNPNTGAVVITSGGSAAGNLAITEIDPRAGITLTWTDQSNSELWFEVQRSTDGTHWTTIGKTPFDVGTSFSDPTGGNAFGSPTISYFYRVRGVNFDGAGPFTSIVSTTSSVLFVPPTISSIVQGSPGTAGLIFSPAAPSGIDTGGLDVQYAPVTAGATGAFVDATPVPLPFNILDYQVTRLSAFQEYVFRAQYATGPNNTNPNLFSVPVAFTPSGGVAEQFGVPGTGSAGFPTTGDLLPSGNANLTGPGIPPVPNPASAPATVALPDISNPTVALAFTSTAGVTQPTLQAGITTSPNNLALTVATSFFLEYTWLTASGGQTLPSAQQMVAGPPGAGFFQITYQVPSSAPAGAVNANVYIGTNTTNSSEFLAGTVAPGATLKIVSFPTTPVSPPIVSNTGLLPGTYYVVYTFLNSSNQESGPSPEQTITLPNPSNDLTLQAPAFPNATPSSTVTAANVYLGAVRGGERLSGTIAASGGGIAISTQPIGLAPPVSNTAGLPAGTYYIAYTWQSDEPNQSAAAESQPSPLSTLVIGTSNSDLAVTIPTAPLGAGNANVYIGAPIANPTAPPTLTQGTNGFLAAGGTYFVRYEWLGSGVTLPSPEQTIVLGANDHEFVATPPPRPFGAQGAKIFVSSLSGAETLYGTLILNGGFTVTALPLSAPSVDTVNTTGQFPLRAATVGASTASQQILLRSISTSGAVPPPANPTTPAPLSVIPALANPTAPATLSVALDPSSLLTPQATYFVEYTWLAKAGGETAASPEATIVLDNNLDDLSVTIPAAPAGAGNANVYIGTASGAEHLVAQIGGGTVVLIDLAPASAAAAPTSSTTSLLSPGTYYLDYAWTNGTYQTVASPEQTVVVTASDELIAVTLGASPVGSGAARVYLGTAPGQELFAGATSSTLNTLGIHSLPDTGADYAAAQTSPVARYFTQANAFQLTSNAASQTGAAFNLGEDVAGFVTSFDFQLTGNMNPQGFGFVLQDQSQGALPSGNFSAGLGPSLGIFFNPDLATTGGNSTGLSIDGAVPTWIDMTQMNGTPTGIVLSSANPLDQRAGEIYNVTLSYDNNTHLLSETVKDLTTNARGFNALFTTTYSIDIVATLGMPAAYVGFVGTSTPGSGEQDILNWIFNGGLSGPPIPDTINGTNGIDQITLRQDPDHQHIDWILNGGPAFAVPINEPNGLTIRGNGGNDVITLDYSNGDPLPNSLHLDSGSGNFTIDGLQGTAPLAGTTIDIERSTLFINYGSGPDPLALIQGYIKSGYNGGNWTGTSAAGVITSANAAANHIGGTNTTGIGYADSADGQGVDTIPNTIELKYTLYCDANLDGQVNSADLQIMLFGLNRPGSWDQGDFNYDGQVNSADLQNLLFTLNTSLGTQATPLAVAATPAAKTTTAITTPSSGSDPPPHLLPTIDTTGSTTSPSHHRHPGKVAVRKRR